jgi:DNA (cytosine-5)-methyltransferase 1
MSLDIRDELIIDNFAGGGGTSTGLEQAFGRPVDIAINHDPEALAMHAINHPHTRHICESVWEVDPIKVTGNQPVALVWLSPDCKHFSKAKGGTPVAKHIRGLAWVAMRWAARCKPRIIMLENVSEFKTWGPLIIGTDGNARPDPARKGKTFDSFLRQLRAHGYTVDHQELRASDHDTPTIRKRFFLVARRDGLPIVWPQETNGDPVSPGVIAGKLAAWRTAADCIDFSLPARSIFGRDKDLAINTQRRVAKGAWRYVLTAARPFFVGQGGPAYSGKPATTDKPFGTLTTENHRAVVQPVLAPFIGEHANSSNQRNMPADEPLRTQCAQVKGGHFSVIAPVLTPLRGTDETHLAGDSVTAPLSTISAGGTHHALAEAHMVAAHIQRDMGNSVGHCADTPLGTVTAGGGGKSALIGAHLITIGYGERQGQPPRVQNIEGPLNTVVSASKHAMVAAHLVDMGHGEGAGGKRWSHGVRSVETPLNTVTPSVGPSYLAAAHLTHLTHHGERDGNAADEPLRTVTGAHRGEQALVTTFLEQANGGFYDGDGRAADAPVSTITSSGSNQRLVTAYFIKYYGEGGQWQGADEPMHTLTTKARMGLMQTIQVPADLLAREMRERARQCAALFHEHLPEHFPEPADLILMGQWALVDITLRMLTPRGVVSGAGLPRELRDP